MRFNFAALLIAFLLMTASWVAHGGVASDNGPQRPACPLGSEVYQAKLLTKKVSGTMGEPLFLEVRLEPPNLPSGFFAVTSVDFLETPEGEKPKLVPGYPRIRITCAEPGIYRLRVRVSLIAKSSCGGAKARMLTEEEATVTIRP